MPDNEYVVTIELKVIVDDPESLVVAGAGLGARAPGDAERDVGVYGVRSLASAA
ncbi:MAG: hypothetical protein LH469_04725 [Frankiaceae bacterium]|nr:hypothetical protein [Frankiaceae bacterium]